GEVVGGLGDQAQVGQGIADLGPLVEPKTADNPVVEADLYEAVFELAGLVLGAHEDRDLLERQALAFEPFDLLPDAARFLRGVPHADHADLFPGRQLRPQRFAETPAVGLDQTGSGRENLRGRAIVLLQPNYGRTREILFEPKDIGDFCPAPGIDRLIVVADHADVFAGLGE